jgi:hypothetical protein
MIRTLPPNKLYVLHQIPVRPQKLAQNTGSHSLRSWLICRVSIAALKYCRIANLDFGLSVCIFRASCSTGQKLMVCTVDRHVRQTPEEVEDHSLSIINFCLGRRNPFLVFEYNAS